MLVILLYSIAFFSPESADLFPADKINLTDTFLLARFILINLSHVKDIDLIDSNRYSLFFTSVEIEFSLAEFATLNGLPRRLPGAHGDLPANAAISLRRDGVRAAARALPPSRANSVKLIVIA